MCSRFFILNLSFLFLSCGKTFAQQQIDCACPLNKGTILIDNSHLIFGGKQVPVREIRGKRVDVLSASDGVIASIDTTAQRRIFILIEFKEYSFRYENLMTTLYSVGQPVKKGDKLGELEKGANLLIGVSDEKAYIEPEKILPCKTKVVKSI